MRITVVPVIRDDAVRVAVCPAQHCGVTRPCGVGCVLVTRIDEAGAVVEKVAEAPLAKMRLKPGEIVVAELIEADDNNELWLCGVERYSCERERAERDENSVSEHCTIKEVNTWRAPE